LKVEGTHPIQLSTAGAYRQKTDATPTLNTNILSPPTFSPEILGIISLTPLAHPSMCLASVSVTIGLFVEIANNYILSLHHCFIIVVYTSFLKKVSYSIRTVTTDLTINISQCIENDRGQTTNIK
jgi:hypothetical protein